MSWIFSTCLSLILRFSWKVFSIKFDCWIFIFMVKKSARKSRNLTVKKIVFFIGAFPELIRRSPPLFRTAILVHLNETGLWCNIFLERHCIRFIKSIYLNKLRLKQLQKYKAFALLMQCKYGEVVLILTCVFVFSLLQFWENLKGIQHKF